MFDYYGPRWRHPLVLIIVGAAAIAAITIGAVHFMRPQTNVVSAGPKGGPVASPASSATHYLVSTTPTAEEAGFSLPAEATVQLEDLAAKNGSLTRVLISPAGHSSSKVQDLTARENGPKSRATTSEVRKKEQIAKEIAKIGKSLNHAPTGAGSRSLYNGLLHTVFEPDADITIVSSGIDLADPLDFRSLRWSTPSSAVVERLKQTKELAALEGARITFVVIPPAGEQPQLRVNLELEYLEDMWKQVLLAGGAKSVRFEVADANPAVSKLQAPIVPPASTISTPTVVCNVADSAFVGDHPVLLHPIKVQRAIGRCTDAAAWDDVSITVEAWTAYRAPLTAAQRAHDETLSKDRAKAIRALISGVPKSSIHIVGHGDSNQPYPSDPSSAKNRIARITISPAA